MSRSKSVIKNAIWEMGYYIIVILFGFLAPRYIILSYGSEVNGLTTTIQHIINIVLMLQAGAATASIYSLYKPIAQNDIDAIKDNIASAEAFFKKISYIFSGIIIIVAIVTPFVLNTSLEKIFVFAAMMIMGAKSFIDLYNTAKYRIIFTAYQQKKFISIATLIEQIIYYAMVFITLWMHWHYILIYMWFLLGCLVKVICLECMLRKTHPRLVKIKSKSSKGVIGDRNYALINEVSHSFMGSSVTILMSFMYTLAETSVYSIYALVNDALNLIITSLYSAFAPSFGDLYAYNNKKKNADIFSIFQYIFCMFGTFLMMCMLFSIIPFVKIYTSGATDINYVNYTLATIMAVGGVFSVYRIPYNIIVSSCGFFKETYLQPAITAAACICVSILCGKFEYSFSLVGLLLFYAINFLYQHIKLKQLVPYLIKKNIFIQLAISLIGVIGTFIIINNFNFPEGIVNWILFSTLYALFAGLYLLLISFLFEKTLVISSFQYIKSIIKRK